MGKQLSATTEVVRNIFSHDPHFTKAEEAERFAEFDVWHDGELADAWDEAMEYMHGIRSISAQEFGIGLAANPYRKDKTDD